MMLYPLVRSGWGSPLFRDGVSPGQGQGTPCPGMGYPPARSGWGTPWPGMGYPLARDEVPHPQMEYAWTGYAAGSTPLAVPAGGFSS